MNEQQQKFVEESYDNYMNTPYDSVLETEEDDEAWCEEWMKRKSDVQYLKMMDKLARELEVEQLPPY